MNDQQHMSPSPIDRRQMLAQSAGLAAVGGLALGNLAFGRENVPHAPVANKGNIRQSIVSWCFSKHWDIEKTCQVARQLGVPSVELVAPEHWPTLRKHG